VRPCQWPLGEQPCPAEATAGELCPVHDREARSAQPATVEPLADIALTQSTVFEVIDPERDYAIAQRERIGRLYRRGDGSAS
jgi:hypothetical protein